MKCCDGECNQGRDCPRRQRREVNLDDIAVLLLAIAAATAMFVIAVLIGGT